MKKLLNTLFITTQGSYLSKDGECVLVKADNDLKGRFPVHNLEGLICFGNVLCSPFLLGHCARHHVAVSMFTENGRFLARVVGEVSGNVLLRREQYRRAEVPEASADIARAVVLAKVANCRTVLQRALRDRPDSSGAAVLKEAADHLSTTLRRSRDDTTVDSIRGREGDAGRVYFGAFDALLSSGKTDFQLEKRSRRPPLNRMNALLSFIYTLLLHDVIGALESVGLDPQVGYLHRDRPGRPGLALDLMEELRPVIADRLALSLVNRGQLSPTDFRVEPGGAVFLGDSGRKAVLKAYQERKRDELQHPFTGETVKVGLLPYVQALLFCRFLRNDLDAYTPFFWK